MKIMLDRGIKTTLVAASLLIAIAPAHATLVSYTNEAAWNADVGPLSGTEDFNSFATDTTFQNTTVSANNMQISGELGSNGGTTNTIDAASYAFSGFYNIDGSSYLLADLVDQQTFRIDFDSSVTAWGGTFSGISDEEIRNTTISAYDSNNVLLGILNTSSLTNSARDFYGFNFDANEAADYLIFQNVSVSLFSNDVFGIDNIGFVTATADVPAPASLALLGLGLLGLGFSRNKRS